MSDLAYEGFMLMWDEALAKAGADFARWSVTGYRGHRTRDGVAWVATLRLDGKAVAQLEESGQGGGVEISFWTYTRNREAEAAWTADVRRVLPGEGPSAVEIAVEALLRRAGR